MSKTQWIWAAAIVALLAAGVAGFSYWRSDSQPDLTAGSAAAGASAAASLPPDSIGPDEHVMGNPKAPVNMIEYFAQACSVCAHFDQEVFPLLKAKYIDTGKVRYVMRLFPLFPIDGPSYKLDNCVPRDQFFHATDLLFRNQPQWDNGEYPVSDPHAGLIKMARILGLSAEQADACMNSTKLDASINKTAQDAVTRYNPDGTPTFVIDFKKVDMPQKSWEEIQAALDSALASKGAK